MISRPASACSRSATSSPYRPVDSRHTRTRVPADVTYSCNSACPADADHVAGDRAGSAAECSESGKCHRPLAAGRVQDYRSDSAVAEALRVAAKHAGDRGGQRPAVAGRAGADARRLRCAAVGGLCRTGPAAARFRIVRASEDAHPQGGQPASTPDFVYASADGGALCAAPARLLGTSASSRKMQDGGAGGGHEETAACDFRYVQARQCVRWRQALSDSDPRRDAGGGPCRVTISTHLLESL